MIYYAGIGSRETPREVFDRFKRIASELAIKGYTLRSGGAKGADQAFELGCDMECGFKEIYLPWIGFEGSNSELYDITDEAMFVASEFHPYWNNLTQGARKLQARNGYQVLGYEFDEPSKFIICYTRGGKGNGGTGQAIRIAKAYAIPVFDFGNEDAEDKLREYLKMIGEEE